MQRQTGDPGAPRAHDDATAVKRGRRLVVSQFEFWGSGAEPFKQAVLFLEFILSLVNFIYRYVLNQREGDWAPLPHRSCKCAMYRAKAIRL